MSAGFHSACDPEVSFDGLRLLFAARKRPADRWSIYEETLDGGNVRQVTRELGDCRSPCFQGPFFTLDSPTTWRQIAFVGSRAGECDEGGSLPFMNLYSCKLDGSAVCRLTFNFSGNTHPCLLDDGRLLFASWQRSVSQRGRSGHSGLYAINTDGTDYSLFAEAQGKRIKSMPCLTTNGLVVFVENDEVSQDQAGSLGVVAVRRPLHSYRALTKDSDGLFHSPSPLPDGRILVSRKGPAGKDTYGIYSLDPASGKYDLVFQDPRFDTTQAKLVHRRPEPDGRSSNVQEGDPHGKLYCLDVSTSDLNRDWTPPGIVKRLRVLEGVPSRTVAVGLPAAETVVVRRVLGEIAVEDDGSFNIEIPANTPIQLQTLDERGMALRSCAWVWAKNHESRGCIGCHEDGELVPEDRFAKALGHGSAVLCPPPHERRTVDFRHDVLPIFRSKCAGCHGKAGTPLRFVETANSPGDIRAVRQGFDRLLALESAIDPDGKYVHSGRSRTSPLTWHVFGENTSRPWDRSVAERAWKRMPPAGSEPLTEKEKRLLVQWMDTGAMWDAQSAGKDPAEAGVIRDPRATRGIKASAGQGRIDERGGM